MNPFEIIHRHYDPKSDLYRTLVIHSILVAKKARELARTCIERTPGAVMDLEFLSEAALLHDIGIKHCHAPEIFCEGSDPYILHGLHGKSMLEAEGLPRHALVCERHTGAGITKEEVKAAGLPLPERDYLPESLEEKLICVADKFYSKSPGKLWEEKSLAKIEKSLARHGSMALERWRKLEEETGLKGMAGPKT
jgi:uncharacterized protein